MQSLVSNDPPEIILICCLDDIIINVEYLLIYLWKQLNFSLGLFD